MKLATALLAGFLVPAFAQHIQLPLSLDRLADRAEESVDLTLDKSMLRFAGGFLSGRSDEARAKKLIEGLESITVRSYEFASEGEYTPADLDAVRAQLQTPVWSRIVGVKSMSGENVDVYFKSAAAGQIGGVVVLAAEPRQLTIVSIVGTIEPSQLGELGGQFRIPRFRFNSGREGR